MVEARLVRHAELHQCLGEACLVTLLAQELNGPAVRGDGLVMRVDQPRPVAGPDEVRNAAHAVTAFG